MRHWNCLSMRDNWAWNTETFLLFQYVLVKILFNTLILTFNLILSLLFQSIVAEIESSWSGMVGQVVGSLRGDLPLPRCLQLVGLLRSMDAFTEPELRIKFLQARDSWLQGLLNAIPKEDCKNLSFELRCEARSIESLFTASTLLQLIFILLKL